MLPCSSIVSYQEIGGKYRRECTRKNASQCHQNEGFVPQASEFHHHGFPGIESFLSLHMETLQEPIPRRYQKTAAGRDISLYQANEAAPHDDYLKNFLISLLTLASSNPDKVKRLRRYCGSLDALAKMWIIYTRLVC